jgi:hypothetical protein
MKRQLSSRGEWRVAGNGKHGDSKHVDDLAHNITNPVNKSSTQIEVFERLLRHRKSRLAIVQCAKFLDFLENQNGRKPGSRLEA